MLKFKYEGLEQVNQPREDRSYYLHFVVRYAPTNDVIFDFYTNRDFEGMFLRNKTIGRYVQVTGTCQFTLSHKTVNAARNALRRMAIRMLTDKHICVSCGDYSEGVHYTATFDDGEEYYQCEKCHNEVSEFDYTDPDTHKTRHVKVVNKGLWIPPRFIGEIL
jgi:hypothetical protein